MYRRPLSAIFGPLRDAGFAIDVLDEPQPVAEAQLPGDMLQVLRTAPVFLFVRAGRSH